MRFTEALAELDGRRETRMVPDLSRILRLATLLDDPQLRYPTIHITGTNGKGTAARVAMELACASGLTTGLYTSPHLQSVTERLTVCGQPMSEDEFADEYGHLVPFLELIDAEAEDRVTYFEALTALAYLWFADKPVGLGVFEVGMGGEWDATNLVSGDVAVLTPIALDHPELGSTVAEVAAEKAGIIKAGAVVVSREQDAEALAVLGSRCTEVGADLRLEFEEWEVEERLQAVGGQALRVRGTYATYDEVFLPLFGEHAARNAGAAIVAIEGFAREALDVERVREAVGSVRWPGRMEVAARSPLLILDGAHNPAGAEALSAALLEAFSWTALHLVVTISDGKDVDGIAEHLAPLADRVYAARNASDRSGDASPIVEAFSVRGREASAFADVVQALDAARDAAGEDDLILVTGSLYTVADARRALGLAP